MPPPSASASEAGEDDPNQRKVQPDRSHEASSLSKRERRAQACELGKFSFRFQFNF